MNRSSSSCALKRVTLAVSLLAALALTPCAWSQVSDASPGAELSVPGFARCAISQTCTVAAAARESGHVVLFNAELVALGTLQPTLSSCPISLEFSPDGRMLAALESDGTVALWDVGAVAIDPSHPARVIESSIVDGKLCDQGDLTLSWCPDSQRFLRLQRAGEVDLYRTNGELVAHVDTQQRVDGELDALWHRATESFLLRDSSGVSAYAWGTGAPFMRGDVALRFECEKLPSAFAFSPDQAELVVGTPTLSMRFYAFDTGAETRRWQFTKDWSIDKLDRFWQLRYSSDGSKLAYVSARSIRVGVLQTEDLNPIFESGHGSAHVGAVEYARWTNDGTQLAAPAVRISGFSCNVNLMPLL